LLKDDIEDPKKPPPPTPDVGIHVGSVVENDRSGVFANVFIVVKFVFGKNDVAVLAVEPCYNAYRG